MPISLLITSIDPPKLCSNFILTDPKENIPGFFYNNKIYKLPFDYSDVCNVWEDGGFILMQTPKKILYFQFEDDESGKVIVYNEKDQVDLPNEVIGSHGNYFYFKTDTHIQYSLAQKTAEGPLKWIDPKNLTTIDNIVNIYSKWGYLIIMKENETVICYQKKVHTL